MSARRTEWRATLALAVPLIFAELGWIAMGLEDTMFVGRLDGELIGPLGLGTTVYHTVAAVAGGLPHPHRGGIRGTLHRLAERTQQRRTHDPLCQRTSAA